MKQPRSCIAIFLFTPTLLCAAPSYDEAANMLHYMEASAYGASNWEKMSQAKRASELQKAKATVSRAETLFSDNRYGVCRGAAIEHQFYLGNLNLHANSVQGGGLYPVNPTAVMKQAYIFGKFFKDCKLLVDRIGRSD